ncbi:MAG: DUF6477 family protein [Gemmobacter sp.]
MTDFRSHLAALSRPRLLVRAARYGLQDYRRDRDLKRLIDTQPGLTASAAMARLVDAEEQVEKTRRAGDAAYSVARHIELLIAMMAETALIAR